MNERELLECFTRAVARKQGWFDKGRNGIPGIARRLNNPCLLEHWKDPDGESYPQVCGAVQFPDEATGWRAARSQFRINIFKRKLTFREVFAGKPGTYRGFCPKVEGVNATSFAHDVANAMTPGTDINVVVASLVVANGKQSVG